MNRRILLQLLASPLLDAREFRCDVAVIGGGVGGCAAAMAALRNGMKVSSDRRNRLDRRPSHLAGRAARRASLDRDVRRNPAIPDLSAAAFASTTERNYPLTELARSREQLNPGGGTVSRLTHEPRVSLAVLEAMLAPYISSGQLHVLLSTGRSRPMRRRSGSFGNRPGIGESGPDHRRQVLPGCDRAGRPASADEDRVRHWLRIAESKPASSTRRLWRNPITFSRLQCVSRWNT